MLNEYANLHDNHKATGLVITCCNDFQIFKYLGQGTDEWFNGELVIFSSYFFFTFAAAFLFIRMRFVHLVVKPARHLMLQVPSA